MASPSEAIPVLNPLTPLAWLPPSLANQVGICQFLLAGVAGAWIWDSAMSLSEEYTMLRKYRIHLPDIVYLSSRVTTCVFIITTLIFLTGPISNIDCQKLTVAVTWCGAIAMCLNSLLFFLRARAVYIDCPWAVWALAFLWFSTLGNIASTFEVKAIHIGPTSACVDVKVDSLTCIGVVIIGLHDTIVYLLIGIRLTMLHLELNNDPSHPPSTLDVLKTFFGGSGMRYFSKSLLMSGQFYYLTTVGLNIAVAISVLVPSFPPVYRAMLGVTNVALQNAMACRVFRQLKIGRIKDGSMAGTLPTVTNGSSEPKASSSSSIKFSNPFRNTSHSGRGYSSRSGGSRVESSMDVIRLGSLSKLEDEDRVVGKSKEIEGV